MCEIRDEERADVGLCEAECEVRARVCWGVLEEGQDTGEMRVGKVGEYGLAAGVEKLAERFSLWIFGVFGHFCKVRVNIWAEVS